jgi:hypothetical protein
MLKAALGFPRMLEQAQLGGTAQHAIEKKPR